MYVHGLEVEFDVATKLIQTKRICSNLEMTLISFLHKWNDLFEGFQIWHSTQISSCWLQSALSIEVRGLSEPGGLGGYAPPPSDFDISVNYISMGGGQIMTTALLLALTPEFSDLPKALEVIWWIKLRLKCAFLLALTTSILLARRPACQCLFKYFKVGEATLFPP